MRAGPPVPDWGASPGLGAVHVRRWAAPTCGKPCTAAGGSPQHTEGASETEPFDPPALRRSYLAGLSKTPPLPSPSLAAGGRQRAGQCLTRRLRLGPCAAAHGALLAASRRNQPAFLAQKAPTVGTAGGAQTSPSTRLQVTTLRLPVPVSTPPAGPAHPLPRPHHLPAHWTLPRWVCADLQVGARAPPPPSPTGTCRGPRPHSLSVCPGRTENTVAWMVARNLEIPISHLNHRL